MPLSLSNNLGLANFFLTSCALLLDQIKTNMMKNTFLIVAIAIFGFGASSNAQEYWNFGIKGGANFTNMTSDGFEDNNSRTGFHLGVLAEIPVSERFSIQPEVLYSTQGTEEEGSNFTNEYKLDYIQLPVIAKFYVIDGLALEAGPTFNFLVNEEYDFESGLLDIIRLRVCQHI